MSKHLSDFERALVDTTADKVYLEVPFEESQKAKEYGARWDQEERKWYVYKDHKNYKKLTKKYSYDNKVFLDVPYDEKDYAKEMGAKWDADEKKWYVYKKDKKLFDKWL